jgi:hypothetical protein
VERLAGGLLDDVRVGHLVAGLIELHGPVDDRAGVAFLGWHHLERDLEVLVEVDELAVHHAVRHHLILVVCQLQLLLGERQHRHTCNTTAPRSSSAHRHAMRVVFSARARASGSGMCDWAMSITLGVLEEADGAGGLAVALDGLDALVLLREDLGEQLGGVTQRRPQLVRRGLHLHNQFSLGRHLLCLILTAA